jgi:thymidine phosphorylase
VKPVFAAHEGILTNVDGRKFGNAIIELGGGRRKVDDELDLSVGFVDVAPVGATIDGNRPLAVVHAADNETAALASDMLRAACVLGESAPPDRAVIHKILAAE